MSVVDVSTIDWVTPILERMRSNPSEGVLEDSVVALYLLEGTNMRLVQWSATDGEGRAGVLAFSDTTDIKQAKDVPTNAQFRLGPSLTGGYLFTTDSDLGKNIYCQQAKNRWFGNADAPNNVDISRRVFFDQPDQITSAKKQWLIAGINGKSGKAGSEMIYRMTISRGKANNQVYANDLKSTPSEANRCVIQMIAPGKNAWRCALAHAKNSGYQYLCCTTPFKAYPSLPTLTADVCSGAVTCPSAADTFAKACGPEMKNIKDPKCVALFTKDPAGSLASAKTACLNSNAATCECFSFLKQNSFSVNCVGPCKFDYANTYSGYCHNPRCRQNLDPKILAALETAKACDQIDAKSKCLYNPKPAAASAWSGKNPTDKEILSRCLLHGDMTDFNKYKNVASQPTAPLSIAQLGVGAYYSAGTNNHPPGLSPVANPPPGGGGGVAPPPGGDTGTPPVGGDPNAPQPPIGGGFDTPPTGGSGQVDLGGWKVDAWVPWLIGGVVVFIIIVIIVMLAMSRGGGGGGGGGRGRDYDD